MKKQFKADMALLAVTVVWGVSFLLSKNSMNELQPYNFLAIRFFIAFVISSLIFIKRMSKMTKNTIKYGIILGIIMFIMYALQTVGLYYTTVSKSAFITGMNVILVPIFSALILKRVPQRKVIISTIIAFIGLGLLTIDDNIGNLNIGDILTLISAFVIALYVIYVGKYTIISDSVALAIVQFGMVALLSTVATFLVETPAWPVTSINWISIFFLSIMCTSLAFIVQSVAQKYTSPSHTALIFTFEPVFAALFGYLFLSEILPPRGLLGAGLIVGSMILMEIEFKAKRPKQSVQ
ncbi:MAG: DMT family transporter [Tissierellales bacterium]|nr:DMT family transporter [Tissierellales bacterium]MBN2827629.1 DMT family transporter [Tissierellales bacterium]